MFKISNNNSWHYQTAFLDTFSTVTKEPIFHDSITIFRTPRARWSNFRHISHTATHLFKACKKFAIFHSPQGGSKGVANRNSCPKLAHPSLWPWIIHWPGGRGFQWKPLRGSWFLAHNGLFLFEVCILRGDQKSVSWYPIYIINSHNS